MLTRIAVALLLTVAATACASRQAIPASQPAPPPSALDVGRELIRTGSISLRGKDVQTIRSGVERVAADVGGRVHESSSRDDDWLTMTVRLPAPRLDEAMDRMAGLGKVVERRLRSQDVTDTLIDLEARVKNLRALRDRLRSYLERAANLPEILDVERELARVQSELESLETRLKLLQDRVAVAELTVDVSKSRWWG